MELGEDGEKADQFARNNVPAVKHAKLLSFRRQVVAGTIYLFKYEGHPTEVKVWSRPWLNLMAIQE